MDFAVGIWPEIHLVQVCMDISDSATKGRELRSLREAMRELKVRNSLIVTMDNEDDFEFEEGSVKVLPAWKYLLS